MTSLQPLCGAQAEGKWNMHDISLHLLDLIENSITAGSTVVDVEIDIDPHADSLHIVVDDNGTGLAAHPDEVMNPFYTTKSHKRIGLGLSLLQAVVEQSEGLMVLDHSPELGGVRVDVRLCLSHIDRPPIGDLAATVSTMISAHPDVEFRICFRRGHRRVDFNSHRDFRSDDPIAASVEAYKVLHTSFEYSESL